MKLNITITFFSLLFVAFLSLNFSQGPANAQGQDRTGSPFTETSGSCQTCHSTGTFNPTLDVELLQDGEAVNTYSPGQTYLLRYTVTANNGSPAGYGMQSVALTTSDDQAVGSYGSVPAGAQLAELNGRTYFEHSALSSNNVFEIEWTAPEDDAIESVTFYATGIAANGNGASGGDAGASSTLVVELDPNVSNTNELSNQMIQLSAFPNPTNGLFELNLSSRQAGTVQVVVLDMQGRVLKQQNANLGLGLNTLQLDVQDAANGVYMVQVRLDEVVSNLRFIKQ